VHGTCFVYAKVIRADANFIGGGYKVKKQAISILAGLALGVLSFGATADPIGPDNCVNNSCFGNIFTLTYAAISPTEYIIDLRIDTSNTTLDATDFIAQVAFKVVSNSSQITNSPSLFTTAPGTWSLPVKGGLANAGCTTGPQGFVCTSNTDNVNFPALTDGSTYDWVFDIQVGSASDWLLAAGAASIKANYGPDNGKLTSEPITLQPGTRCPPLVCLPQEVPEPATLALLGLGLLGLGFVGTARRRM